jgi:hypothetical protein
MACSRTEFSAIEQDMKVVLILPSVTRNTKLKYICLYYPWLRMVVTVREQELRVLENRVLTGKK